MEELRAQAAQLRSTQAELDQAREELRQQKEVPTPETYSILAPLEAGLGPGFSFTTGTRWLVGRFLAVLALRLRAIQFRHLQ